MKLGGREQGVALIVVLWVIMVLSLLIAGFAFTMHVETQVASFSRKQQKAESLARSGIEVARMQLMLAEKASTNSMFTSLNQPWATNELLYVDHELGEGKFNVKMIDEQSKLPINRLTEAQWKRLMDLLAVDPSDAEVIVDSILDWIDEDDLHKLNGAESDYYQSLSPPYKAKNGTVDRVEELLLVRGVTRQLYDGQAGTNETTGTTEATGWRDLLTTFSPGTVNVNTASRIVLQVMFGLDDVQVAGILARRDGIDGIPGTDDDQPFISPSDFLSQIAIQDPKVRMQLQTGVAVKSSYFTVKSTGEVGGIRRTITAVLQRQTALVTVVTWEEQPSAQ